MAIPQFQYTSSPINLPQHPSSNKKQSSPFRSGSPSNPFHHFNPSETHFIELNHSNLTSPDVSRSAQTIRQQPTARHSPVPSSPWADRFDFYRWLQREWKYIKNINICANRDSIDPFWTPRWRGINFFYLPSASFRMKVVLLSYCWTSGSSISVPFAILRSDDDDEGQQLGMSRMTTTTSLQVNQKHKIALTGKSLFPFPTKTKTSVLM